ncbi:MAG: hypothetical protein H7Z10_05045, partial [Gemmatimonadaceae bacterium]|nr:hypothetical protein [Acetobacteraceae bacterium]
TMHAMLGLRPDAPNRRLMVDPVLPDWLPDLIVIGLRLGDQVFDIRFQRVGAATSYAVLRGDPAAIVGWPDASI